MRSLRCRTSLDRIDQVRERGPRLFGYRIIKDEELADAVAASPHCIPGTGP